MGGLLAIYSTEPFACACAYQGNVISIAKVRRHSFQDIPKVSIAYKLLLPRHTGNQGVLPLATM